MTEPVVNLADIRAAQSLDAMLAKNDKGAPLNTVGNIIAVLRHDPALAGLMSYNEFTYESAILRAPPVPDDDAAPLDGPYPRQWTDADVALLFAYVQRRWISRATEGALRSAMAAEGAMRGFHPVREWLATLIWDGIGRLDSWLTAAFGVEKSDYHTDVGAKTLIAAVRRVRQPGCKFDFMVILEGGQGIGKSTALVILFTDKWFSDSLIHDLSNKDAAIGLCGVWCVEMSEIGQMARSADEAIKAFVARRVDKYRPPFGRSDVTRPRQCVLIGTTNRTDYLRDDSGNRRYWPVACLSVDLVWLAANREQLWAEAATREAAGESIWLDDGETQQAAESEQDGRLEPDSWEDVIVPKLEYRTTILMSEILTDILKIPVAQQDRRQELRVGRILRKQKWERSVMKKDGKPMRAWTVSNKRR